VRVLRAILLVPILFALLVGSAAAESSAAGLDPSFGNVGRITVAVPAAGRYESLRVRGLALSPDGRTYVLDNSLLLAFEADGKPAAGFGVGGRVRVEPAGAEGAKGLAVDSQGRVLVTGSVELGDQKRDGHRVRYTPVYAAYVIRYLPDGNRDVTFGDDGEVQTAFGLPRPKTGHGVRYERASATATSIVVDSQDRPIIGGGFATDYEGGCSVDFADHDPFIGRLTVSGAPDATFGRKGYALIGGLGTVSALARTPEGGAATLSFGVSCGARSEEEPSRFSAFTESGEPAPDLDPDRPEFFAEGGMAIDPQGRILAVRIPPPAAEGGRALVRLLPDGDPDPSFGKDGGVMLKGGLAEMGAFAADAESRPILAPFAHRIELRRLGADGAPDPAFGPGGRLFAEGGPAQEVELDGLGRIYTASIVAGKKLKTGFGVQVARFIPGS
jgi:uncharacterized delta-60 repeat protein